MKRRTETRGRRFAVVVFAAATVGFSTSCVKRIPHHSSVSPVLRYPIAAEPKTLDPTLCTSGENQELLQNIYESLVTPDEHDRLAPGLASKWEVSADGTTYTFHLRPTARFHPPFSRQVTTDDVRYSIERCLWPETKSPSAASFDEVIGAKQVMEGKVRHAAGIKVIDPLTIRITLVHPRAYFLAQLPMIGTVCRDAIERNKGIFDDQTAIGSGPFRLQRYVHGAKVTLISNDNYDLGHPKVSAIERPIVLDQHTAHLMYESGQIDICSPSFTDFKQDQRSERLRSECRSFPSAGNTFLTFHMKPLPVARDKRVRQAISLAIDRDALVRVAGSGLCRRADTILSYGMDGFDQSAARIAFDPELARKLLAAAGYPGGTRFPRLTLAYSQSDQLAALSAEMVRADLKNNLGINIDLQAREATSLFSDILADRVSFYYVGFGGYDPHDMLYGLRTGSAWNHIGYSNRVFDVLSDTCDAESDPTRRSDACRKADQFATNDVALVPLTGNTQAFLVKPYVAHLKVNAHGIMPHLFTACERK